MSVLNVSIGLLVLHQKRIQPSKRARSPREKFCGLMPTAATHFAGSIQFQSGTGKDLKSIYARHNLIP